MAVDMWAVGAIIAEMVSKETLFPSDSDVDELFKIFRLLGTPTEASWPRVTELANWNVAFPLWPALRIKNLLPPFCEDGIAMIEVRTTSKESYLSNMYHFICMIHHTHVHTDCGMVLSGVVWCGVVWCSVV